MAALGALRKLNLSLNPSLDADVSLTQLARLPRLEVLSLSDSRLSHLPEAFMALRSLKVLHLYGNALRTLPTGFETLYRMQKLSLDGNPWSDATATLDQACRLRNLEVLAYRDSGLIRVPAALSGLRSLMHLDLGRNPGLDVESLLMSQPLETMGLRGATRRAWSAGKIAWKMPVDFREPRSTTRRGGSTPPGICRGTPCATCWPSTRTRSCGRRCRRPRASR
jgi:hypothetical protein